MACKARPYSENKKHLFQYLKSPLGYDHISSLENCRS